MPAERVRRSGPTADRFWALASAWQLRGLVAGLVVLVAACLLLPSTLNVPTLAPQAAATPTTLIASWFAALLATQGAFEPAWDLYATAGIRPRVLNLVRVAVVGLTGAVIVAALLGNSGMTGVAVASLLGLGLISGAALGHRLCWLAPTGYLLVIIGTGTVNAVGEPRLWAVAGDPSPGAAESALAGAILAVGVATWCLAGSRQAAVQDRG